MLGSVVQRTLGALLLFALTLSVGLGGRTCLWCTGMQEIVERCCCAEAPAEDATITTPSCCEGKVMPALAEAREPMRRELRLPPLAIVTVEVTLALELPPSLALERPAVRARAGPDRAWYQLLHAYLI